MLEMKSSVAWRLSAELGKHLHLMPTPWLYVLHCAVPSAFRADSMESLVPAAERIFGILPDLQPPHVGTTYGDDGSRSSSRALLCTPRTPASLMDLTVRRNGSALLSGARMCTIRLPALGTRLGASSTWTAMGWLSLSLFFPMFEYAEPSNTPTTKTTKNSSTLVESLSLSLEVWRKRIKVSVIQSNCRMRQAVYFYAISWR